MVYDGIVYDYKILDGATRDSLAERVMEHLRGGQWALWGQPLCVMDTNAGYFYFYQAVIKIRPDQPQKQWVEAGRAFAGTAEEGPILRDIGVAY